MVRTISLDRPRAAYSAGLRRLASVPPRRAKRPKAYHLYWSFPQGHPRARALALRDDRPGD